MSCDDYRSQRSKRGPWLKFTMAQIAQVGLSRQSKYDRRGKKKKKSRCEVTVCVQRINSGA